MHPYPVNNKRSFNEIHHYILKSGTDTDGYYSATIIEMPCTQYSITIIKGETYNPRAVLWELNFVINNIYC